MIPGGWELMLMLAVILILSAARTWPEINHHAINRRNGPREIFCMTQSSL